MVEEEPEIVEYDEEVAKANLALDDAADAANQAAAAATKK